jgi:hypothetical protein
MISTITRTFITFNLVFFSVCCYSRIIPGNPDSSLTEKCAKPDSGKKKSQNVRIVFYNTENLYDPYDDTTRLDDEFTSRGSKRWGYSKFLVKLSHFGKTILAMGNPETPAIIGLCEVENRYVLNKIIYESPLRNFHYKLIQYDSPDARGIDVAMLYRPERFKPISSKAIRIIFPSDENIRTRDILYVRGILFGTDTLHLFVNHWPSKFGGVVASEPRRKVVAGILRGYVDSLFAVDKNSNIVIMGDFNDEPDQPSVREVLGAGPWQQDTDSPILVNLMLDLLRDWAHGTHKFQGKWSIIDQFIVSGALINGKHGLLISPGEVGIFQAGFLMEKETSFLGSKPLRTYAGPRYIGGFADHLPIWVNIRKE